MEDPQFKTNDLFVSYARNDNAEQLVDKFVDRLRRQLAIQTGRSDIQFFMDIENIDIGEQWDRRIRSDLEKSRLMLALLSPSYFRSAYCLKEWDYFFDKNKSTDVGLVLPIELVSLVDAETDFSVAEDLDEEELRRWNEAHELQIHTWWRIRHDEAKAEAFFKKLTRTIHSRLRVLDPRKTHIKNTHILDRAVDRTAQAGKVRDLLKSIADTHRAYPTTDPICVIYTGGSVGMVREERENRDSVLKIGSVEELVSRLPKLRELRFDLDFYSYEEPLDSSNIDGDDWLLMASIIKELYPHYQGFVVLHGTNTMAYTASALSFLFENLSKPVVLTGAEIPLVELHSDAERNVLRAAEVAAPDAPRSPGMIPEVCIAFGDNLLRGNRTTKWHSLNVAVGFHSPNFPALGHISNDRISLSHRTIRKIHTSVPDKLEMSSGLLAEGIFVLEVYPDMDLRYYEPALKSDALRGMIMKTYGTGNAPEVPKRFLDLLEYMVSKGVIVLNITQCPQGPVELRLFETNARLFDIGVINGGDMTLEAAYCKIKYLLGKIDPADSMAREVVKQELQIDLRGELSFSAFHLRYDSQSDKAIASPVFQGGPKPIGHFQFDPVDIDHAFVRLQGASIENAPQDEKLDFRIYYNRHGVASEPTNDDRHYEIAHFQRSVQSGNQISHNKEVTDRIRRLVRPGERNATLELVVTANVTCNFESLELVIFTRQ